MKKNARLSDRQPFLVAVFWRLPALLGPSILFLFLLTGVSWSADVAEDQPIDPHRNLLRESVAGKAHVLFEKHLSTIILEYFSISSSGRWKPGNEEQSPKVSNLKSQIPVFDRAGMMVRLMDDKDLAKEIGAAFLKDIPLQIAALKGYLDTGDATGAERQAHTIKGASANMGGVQLCAVAFEIEKAANTGDLDTARGYTAEIEMQFNRLNQAMTKEL